MVSINLIASGKKPINLRDVIDNLYDLWAESRSEKAKFLYDKFITEEIFKLDYFSAKANLNYWNYLTYKERYTNDNL